MAQHWGRGGAHLSVNKSVKSECKKFGENLRKMASVSTICDEDCRLKNFNLNLIWTCNRYMYVPSLNLMTHHFTF